MQTIKENIISEIVINKSKFITEIIKINDIKLIKEYLLDVKNKYKDANHYCYAYIIDNNKKSSDDGEPGGTAGIPIMEVLNKNNLNYVLCIVIRYFGGIKLGAGGLVRAYSKSVSSALSTCSLFSLEDGYKITLEIDYDRQKFLEGLLKNYNYSTLFNEKITYYIDASNELIDILKQNYDVIVNEYIKVEKE